MYVLPEYLGVEIQVQHVSAVRVNPRPAAALAVSRQWSSIKSAAVQYPLVGRDCPGPQLLAGDGLLISGMLDSFLLSARSVACWAGMGLRMGVVTLGHFLGQEPSIRQGS